MAFLRFRVQTWNLLGPVLQVAIHDHHPVAIATIEPGGNAVMLAEIAAELYAFDPWITLRQFHDQRPRAITTAVFNQHDFEVGRQRLQCRLQPTIEFLEAGLGTIDGNDD